MLSGTCITERGPIVQRDFFSAYVQMCPPFRFAVSCQRFEDVQVHVG